MGGKSSSESWKELKPQLENKNDIYIAATETTNRKYGNYAFHIPEGYIGKINKRYYSGKKAQNFEVTWISIADTPGHQPMPVVTHLYRPGGFLIDDCTLEKDYEHIRLANVDEIKMFGENMENYRTKCQKAQMSFTELAAETRDYSDNISENSMSKECDFLEPVLPDDLPSIPDSDENSISNPKDLEVLLVDPVVSDNWKLQVGQMVKATEAYSLGKVHKFTLGPEQITVSQIPKGSYGKIIKSSHGNNLIGIQWYIPAQDIQGDADDKLFWSIEQRFQSRGTQKEALTKLENCDTTTTWKRIVVRKSTEDL